MTKTLILRKSELIRRDHMKVQMKSSLRIFDPEDEKTKHKRNNSLNKNNMTQKNFSDPQEHQPVLKTKRWLNKKSFFENTSSET